MRTDLPAQRLARRWFWGLLLVAVLAMGGLYTALGASSGPGTGLAIGGTSVVVVLASLQAVRIWLALERARRRPAGPAGHRPKAPAAAGATPLRDRFLGVRAPGSGERR